MAESGPSDHHNTVTRAFSGRLAWDGTALSYCVG